LQPMLFTFTCAMEYWEESDFASSTCLQLLLSAIILRNGVHWQPVRLSLSINIPTYCYLQILILGIALSGSGVGTFIMAPISKMLIETYGWRGALLAQSGIAYALVDEFQC